MKFSKRMAGNAMLLLTAMIWGVAFLAQKSGGDATGPLTFNGVRSILGGLMLVVLLPLLDRVKISVKPADKAARRAALLGGVLCGLALFAATNVQQIALQYTTVGKGGFITSLYIVLVPILSLVLGRRPGWLVWVSVAVATVGLYLLCGRDLGAVNIGDLLLIVCALLFAVQILLVSHFAPQTDGVRLSAVQFLTVGVLNLPLMFLFEAPSLSVMADYWLPLLYAGLLSSGVAYTLQVLAQRHTEPTTASMLMSLESVFAVLAGLAVGDRMNGWEIVGCVLMFGAVLLAQLPTPGKKEVTP